MNEIDLYKDRIVTLIRQHAQRVDKAGDNIEINMSQPGLYEIANELEAFFIGLKVAIDLKRNIS